MKLKCSICLILIMLIGSGCAKAVFTSVDDKLGSHGLTPGETPTPTPTPTITPTPTPPPECTQAGYTQAKLLTSRVANGVGGNYLEYEISIVDCNGGSLDLSEKPILFDIDVMMLQETATDLRYTITTIDGSVNGILNIVQGQDLFGRSGSNYFHYKTDKSVPVHAPVKTATLRIELMGSLAFPLSGDLNQTYPLFSSNSYLRFGEAAPVAKSVEFALP